MARQQGILKFKGKHRKCSRMNNKNTGRISGREKSGIEPCRIWDILPGMVILTTLACLTISGQQVKGLPIPILRKP